MQISETKIDDTFAEAFPMSFTRLIVTAHDRYWLDAALREFSGYSSSVIACDLEIGLETYLDESLTPDGRVGASLLAFGFSSDALTQAIANRTGQCIMTCPSTALFDGLMESQKRIPVGRHIRFFGDGFQKSKLINGRRFWRIPVMDGEFLVEESAGVAKGIGGGNIIIQGTDQSQVLAAARRGVDAVGSIRGVIAPFPGGVARSGSKVGSRYKKLKASTAESFCPTLRGRVQTKLAPAVNASLEIVIDGESEEAVGKAMAAAARAAAGAGIKCISAGNYGGSLGPCHLHLHQLLA